MIVVTGAAGFIGSCLVSFLNNKEHYDLMLVDEESKRNHPNLQGKKYVKYIDRDQFISWLEQNKGEVKFIFHIGARTDTTEFRQEIFDKLNINYTKKLWDICSDQDIPFIYASSAATYGMGESGYSDNHSRILLYKPLNPYGWSKQLVDLWILEQTKQPTRWAGFKFFNVFGPNEYHKGRMASVVFHAYHQIIQTGQMKLFRSNDPKIKDGEQRRDFIYVMDLLEVLYHFYEKHPENGIYNLGTGEANTFKKLVEAVFEALSLPTNIEYIPMPEDLLHSYQNYTCADMTKLRQNGYHRPMWDFGKAVQDYVQHYLSKTRYY